MKPEIKARWVAALRSGKYKQGRGYLNADNTFCCLGVLCEIAVEDGVIAKYGTRVVFYGDDESRSHTLLPEAVVQWSGLDSLMLPNSVCVCAPLTLSLQGGCVCGLPRSLVTLNDHSALGLKGIADQIEVQL